MHTGRLGHAAAFWVEARDTFFRLFMDGTRCVVPRTAPPGVRLRLFALLRRLTRFLFCFDADYISKVSALPAHHSHHPE